MADAESEEAMVGLHGRVPVAMKEAVAAHAVTMTARDGKARSEGHAIRELLGLGIVAAEKSKRVDVQKLKKRRGA